MKTTLVNSGKFEYFLLLDFLLLVAINFGEVLLCVAGLRLCAPMCLQSPSDFYQQIEAKFIFESVCGLSEIVNPTLCNTSLSRLYSYYGYEVILVDAYGWLHAAKSKAGVVELISGGHSNPPLYDFLENRLRSVSLGGKFKVYLVFDGHSSLHKEATETDRSKRREDRRKQTRILQADGQFLKATQLLRASEDITPEVAKQVIDHLNSLSPAQKLAIGLHRCVVSINEADPLLGFLNNFIPKSVILSNDYDMVPWKATACLFKVDYLSGKVALYRRDVFDVTATVSNRLLTITQHQLIDICVLAGCDYVKSLTNIAFKKAANLVRQHGK